MIDLHSHLLPEIDDGTMSLQASLSLAQEAVNNGVTIALMTPHHKNGRYLNPKTEVVRLTEQFQKKLDFKKIPLKVFPSQEVRINGDLLQDIDNNDILFADESDKYLLLEFPDDDVPAFSEAMIFSLMQRGINIQIAHPERNTKMIAQPDILFNLIEKGAVAQITASSYVGVFGKPIRRFSETIVSHNLAHVFVSDAHDLPKRHYVLHEALDKLSNTMGRAYKDLFETNAEAILDGKNIKRLPPKKIVKRRFFNTF